MSSQKKIVIHLEAFMLDDKMMMCEIKIEGNGNQIGGLLEGGMNFNPMLASLVIGAAIFHCDAKGIDITKYAEMYRKMYKKMK
jgi:hypothetical protein